MGHTGCFPNGTLNDSMFSEPTPLIGLYVASASLICAIAMASDLVYAIRNRKFWFPSKFFSFNATTLTVITVALKLSVDLNTPMPGRIDQLAKLSSGVLICVVMSNSMPSLGNMEDKDLVMNVIALLILVITVAVNIGIQIGTGVIYIYLIEHGFVLSLMILMAIIIAFSAVTVPIKRQYLEYKYKVRSQCCLSREGNLREELMKLWMMAHTSSPQFVMGRSVTCSAIGAFCILAAITLGEALLRTYLLLQRSCFCSGTSDYRFSSSLILLSQTLAIVIGSLGPAIRWFAAINYKCPMLVSHQKGFFTIENYWVQPLVNMKENPLEIKTENRFLRRISYHFRNKILGLCIATQIGIVLSCKALQLFSIFSIGRLLVVSRRLYARTASVSTSSDSSGLSRYVLHLEGEDDLVELLMRNNRDATIHWMHKGKKKAPRNFERLLESSPASFRGVFTFDAGTVSALEPRASWSLTVVTLMAIAYALPGVDEHALGGLVRSVNEGLYYVRIVEETLCGRVSKAGYALWLAIEFHARWLDVDLRRVREEGDVVGALGRHARRRYERLSREMAVCLLNDDEASWPGEMVAARAMWRVSESVGARGGQWGCVEEMVREVMGACMVSLERAMLARCIEGGAVGKERRVRESVMLLGQCEGILRMVEERVPKGLQREKLCWVDEWRMGRIDDLSFDGGNV